MLNRPAPRARWLALLLAMVLLAAACGGDDDGGGGGGQSSDTTTGGGAQTTTTVTEDETPVPGGKLVYGIEADTSTPWTPSKELCAISCHMVNRSVYDPLALYGQDGQVVPNLAESIEPNDDFTVWTITPRQGVMFHDGTPFDAAAICNNLQRQANSFLTGKVFLNVAKNATGPACGDASLSALTGNYSIELTPDGSAVTITMVTPWTHFPIYLVGQVGYMASPAWLAAADADPTLETRPVGTGPFVFKSYTPGGSFVATKNPNYWRKDEGLPYLDEIEFRVLVDIQSRKAALESGEVDIMHTSNGDTIAEFRGRDDFNMIESDEFGETSYIMLKVDDPSSPLSDVRVRRALAYATDNELLARERGAGVAKVANGPFSPSQLGYLDDTGYPTYDPTQAKALVDGYEAEKGPINFEFATTNDPYNLETNQLIQSMWQAVGVDTTIKQIEQGQYILTALQGQFQAFGWRNHGGVDPDAQRIWWHSDYIEPVNALGLNFGRINDPVIDENLDVIRTSNDDAERKTAAENINRQFGDQVYNIWNTWTVWGIIYNPRVHNVTNFILPDGSPDITGAGIAGTHQVSQIWVDQ